MLQPDWAETARTLAKKQPAGECRDFLVQLAQHLDSLNLELLKPAEVQAELGVEYAYLRACTAPVVELPGLGRAGRPLRRYRRTDLAQWIGKHTLRVAD